MIAEQKLVRDKIPNFPFILPKGHTQEFDELNPDSVPWALIDKIIEEVGELRDALTLKNREQFLEEAGDVLEAFSELLKRTGVTFDAVNKARIEKRKERGGFEKGIWRTVRKEEERE